MGNSSLEEEIARAKKYRLPATLLSLVEEIEGDYFDIRGIPREVLNKQIRKVRRLIKQFQDSEIYRKAKQAWRSSDAEGLRDLIPQIFDSVALVGCQEVLYHGVAPIPIGQDERYNLSFRPIEPHQQGPISATDYVDKIERILKDGLKPSRNPYFYGHDENIRGIFNSSGFYWAQPLIRLEITSEMLRGIPVFRLEDSDGEYVIFTPILRRDFPLIIPPRSHYTNFDYRGWAYADEMKKDHEAELKYRDATKKELERRGIGFQIFTH